MRYHLHYHKGTLEIDLPDWAKVDVIAKPSMPAVSDATLAVEEALNQPVGSAPIEVIAKGAKTACLVICDITRPVPNHLFLRPVIERLHRAGVPLSGITVLVATGLHRPNEGDELAELIGDAWVLEHVNCVNHFARNDDEHADLGKTPTRGTIVRIDQRFTDADVKIVSGLVEPHFMAGYSGGRKVIAPGIAHAETITTFHNAAFMGNPNATNCNFDRNPLHEEQLEILKLLGHPEKPILAVNTIIDEARRLSFINFGDVLASHVEAVNYVKQFCEVKLTQRYQTVVTSSAGYPLDKTYYQTIKGMVGAVNAMAAGGQLYIASKCSEGLGSEEFREALRRLKLLGVDPFDAAIHEQTHAHIDEWQVQKLLEPMRRGRVYLYSDGLSDDEKVITNVTCVGSLQDALVKRVVERPEERIALIPEGPYVIPFAE
jgi:nickel-dependent lactate racemase